MLPERDELIVNLREAVAQARLDEAEVLCKHLLLTDPNDVQAKTLQGIVATKQGRTTEAIAHLDGVLRQEPDAPEALLWLSRCFRADGAYRAAAGAGMRVTQLRSSDPEAFNNLGECQMALLMLPEATRSFERATRLTPALLEAFLNLGKALHVQGQHEQAREAHQRGIRMFPNSADLHVGLGRSVLSLGLFDDAVQHARKAHELEPSLASAHIFLAQLLVQMSLADEARAHAHAAIHAEPRNALAYAVLGLSLQGQGRLDDANAAFLKSIELEPRQGYSYSSMIFGRRVTEDDRGLINTMDRLTMDRSLPQSDIQALHYAIGKTHEAFKEYEAAMKHFNEGNRIAHYVKFRGQPFDRARHEGSANRVMSYFTEDRFRRHAALGSSSDKPIFIVGMIRSGTTLMEQILSRHPRVAAAGEQSFWTKFGPSAFDPATGSLNPDRIAGLASEYLALLDSVAPEGERITDKMPANALMLGFIHVAFPNARIIHMVRNPADVCLSIYTTPNEGRFEFAHNRANIAFACRTHLRLMRHWRETLPSETLTDVVYEELIQDQEGVTRRTLDFLGLEWSDLCLSPEQNERAVATPSVWQVRQPVYKTSVQRWKHFEPWIPEFAELANEG